MEDPKQTKNYSNKEQFVISGSNNTIHIHNDSSAVRVIDGLLDENKRKSAFATMQVDAFMNVIKTVSDAALSAYEKSKGAAAKTPAPTKRKAPVKKVSPKKRKK